MKEVSEVIDLPSLAAGFDFPPQTLVLDPVTVSAYVRAVDDPYEGYQGDRGVVPPLAVLALAMRGLTDLLAHFPGVLHLTQQLTSHRPIPIGSTVTSFLTVRSRSERRGFAALTLEARVLAANEPAIDGGLLLMVPLRGETANG
jgi:acyl dehydratase